MTREDLIYAGFVRYPGSEKQVAAGVNGRAIETAEVNAVPCVDRYNTIEGDAQAIGVGHRCTPQSSAADFFSRLAKIDATGE